MPDEGTFYAPVGYSVWWPLLGAALLVLCLGAAAWMWISTRPRHDATVPGFAVPPNPESVRERYLLLMSAILQRHDAGELGSRAAHLELSLALRTFVHEMTGLHTQRMTLTQLRAHGLPLVGDAVELLYPGEFSADGGQLTVAQAAHTAQDVVHAWR